MQAYPFYSKSFVMKPINEGYIGHDDGFNGLNPPDIGLLYISNVGHDDRDDNIVKRW